MLILSVKVDYKLTFIDTVECPKNEKQIVKFSFLVDKYLTFDRKYQNLDNTGREVARFNRPFNLTCRCCTSYMPCCLQEMEITASGITIGWILQKADFCNPVFQVCDADKQVLLEIKGPICAFSCCCSDINFEVLILLYLFL